MRTYRPIVLTVIAALVGGCVGWAGGNIVHILPRRSHYAFLAKPVPLPHHVPQFPGGVSFRFAMAHDVIHQRFPKHGPAHYRERDRLTRESLEKLAPDDPARFPLADDLAVGLERLGRSDEATAVMRDKLARQEAQGMKGRSLYTSYANLGTFLIHGSFQKAAAGDEQAKKRSREGIALIRKSVEVNPEAHFGRERWQESIAEFLLAAMDKPDLLTTYDCLGNRLDMDDESMLNGRRLNWSGPGYGRPYDFAFVLDDVDDEVPKFFAPGTDPEKPALWPEINPIRAHITKIGAEAGWDAVAIPSHREPVPFDEPILGIIGMWRQGGGANPHFALAIGETMIRAGQRFIAWDAYERAAKLADRYSRDPQIQEFLREHCRKRQAQIERSLSVGPEILRSKFNGELAYGETYQKEYQNYEAARIAAGTSILDAQFYEPFRSSHAEIASPSGPEEWYSRVPVPALNAYINRYAKSWGLFCAGLLALTTASALSLRSRSKSKTDALNVSGVGIDRPWRAL